MAGRATRRSVRASRKASVASIVDVPGVDGGLQRLASARSVRWRFGPGDPGALSPRWWLLARHGAFIGPTAHEQRCQRPRTYVKPRLPVCASHGRRRPRRRHKRRSSKLREDSPSTNSQRRQPGAAQLQAHRVRSGRVQRLPDQWRPPPSAVFGGIPAALTRRERPRAVVEPRLARHQTHDTPTSEMRAPMSSTIQRSIAIELEPKPHNTTSRPYE